MIVTEFQVTDRPGGHILTNIGVWSPDGQWIVYDTRSDPAGERFDGATIEMVHADTREVREIYRARNGAHCGVATFSPTADRVVFILGPENPTPDWQYGPSHRQGVIVDLDQPGVARPLDARNIVPPFTPGALRGGSHVHVYSADGAWVSFTYDDCLLTGAQRNIGVSAPVQRVGVPKLHPRNHDGAMFSVLVTKTAQPPTPGTDEVSRACEEAWIGTHGYVRADGTRQRHAIAFQGDVVTSEGRAIREAFLVDVPEDVTSAGIEPLEGTATTLPAPPRGTKQRRLTYTADRKHPGLQGPRHWLQSSPDGTRIAVLMRDDAGVVQLWIVSPLGGEPTQITHSAFDVASAFSWSPNGESITYIADTSVFVTCVATGESLRLTAPCDTQFSPRPEACVFSPAGDRISYVRPVEHDGATWNQVFIATLPAAAATSL
jgi:hypothetical protein